MPFIMAATLIDMISIGIIIPVMPVLVGQFTASQAEQAFWFGAVTFTFAVANFFASPILGALSDHFGRRPVLIAAMSLFFASAVLAVFATGVRFLLVARVLQALGGCGGLVLGRAMVRDGTTPERAAGQLALRDTQFHPASCDGRSRARDVGVLRAAVHRVSVARPRPARGHVQRRRVTQAGHPYVCHRLLNYTI